MDNDLSKIISVIMENPDIINKIRSLADSAQSTETEAVVSDTDTQEAEVSDNVSDDKKTDEPVMAFPQKEMNKSQVFHKKRHRELLCALKPYVSKDRARTIDTMLSVIEIIDLVKAR